MTNEYVKLSAYLSGLKPPRKIVLSQHELTTIIGIRKADRPEQTALVADAEKVHYTLRILENGTYEFKPNH